MPRTETESPEKSREENAIIRISHWLNCGEQGYNEKDGKKRENK